MRSNRLHEVQHRIVSGKHGRPSKIRWFPSGSAAFRLQPQYSCYMPAYRLPNPQASALVPQHPHPDPRLNPNPNPNPTQSPDPRCTGHRRPAQHPRAPGAAVHGGRRPGQPARHRRGDAEAHAPGHGEDPLPQHRTGEGDLALHCASTEGCATEEGCHLYYCDSHPATQACHDFHLASDGSHALRIALSAWPASPRLVTSL